MTGKREVISSPIGVSTDKRACIDWSRENLGAIRVQQEFQRVP